MDAVATKPNSKNQHIIETALEIVAETKGDITQDVIDIYFKHYPNAKKLFVEHSVNNGEAELQQEMVAQALYCIMTFYERPIEVEIVLLQTVPHHDQLTISVEYFIGLLNATFDVLLSGLSNTQHAAEIDCLESLREQLKTLVYEAE